jgi:hypothetical protein
MADVSASAPLARTAAGPTFKVEITTGGVDGAGTDANVHLTLYGPGCVLARKQLDHPDPFNDFEPNTDDPFIVQTHGLPGDPVTAIQLGHDNTKRFPGWFVESVKITNTSGGAPKTFRIHRWLAKDEVPYAINYYTDESGVLTPLPDTHVNSAKALPTMPCDDPRLRLNSGQISITGLEVTQGIQVNDGPAVPLVAGKRTFVRAYVRAGGVPVSGVTATLTSKTTLTSNDSSAPVQIVNTKPVTITASGSNHATLDDSFLFELPQAMTAAGTRFLTVQLNPPGANGQSDPLRTDTEQVRFYKLPDNVEAPHLDIYPFGYSDLPRVVQLQQKFKPGTTRWWPFFDMNHWTAKQIEAQQTLLDRVVRLASNLLPVTGITYKLHPPLYFACGRLAKDGAGIMHCDGAVDDARAWAEEHVDVTHGEGGGWYVMLQPEVEDSCGCGNEFTMAGTGNRRISFKLTSRAEWTLAHEMAHGYGAHHTPEVSEAPDLDYPRADGSLGPYVGLSWFTGSKTIVPVPGTGKYDLMSYQRGEHWISPYTFCKTLDGISNGKITCDADVDAGSGQPFPYTTKTKS